MRVKPMPLGQFDEVMKREWRPVQLAGTAVPTWLQNIPGTVLHSVYGSGAPFLGTVYVGPGVPSAELVGGIDVYRYAPDDPVELNKDWYAVVRVPGTASMLLATSPFKDAEHWLNAIPERLTGAEVLGVPRKPDERAAS
jgi:hypothetical protein